MSLIVSKTDYQPHPTGFYTAKMVEMEKTDGEYGEQIKMIFETDQINEFGDPFQIWHYCSLKLSRKSKLAKTVTGITGKRFEELANDLDLEGLIGSETQIMVEHTESQNGRLYAKIASFLPANVKSEISSEAIAQIKDLMVENNVEIGILENFYDVDAVEKLTVTQVKEFAEKLKSGELIFTLPEASKDTDTIPF